jgi:hypothetical protein
MEIKVPGKGGMTVAKIVQMDGGVRFRLPNSRMLVTGEVKAVAANSVTVLVKAYMSDTGTEYVVAKEKILDAMSPATFSVDFAKNTPSNGEKP